MKFCAIKNPSGEWVGDAIATTEEQAWQYAGDIDHDFPRHPEYHLSESGEAAGYRCVEVELAEPGTAEALKRAREAWATLAPSVAHLRSDSAGVGVLGAALNELYEVLGRVTPGENG